MSKAIKLTDGVYIALEAIREKRETFSETVERIIRVYLTIKEVSDTLGPGHWLKERPELREDEVGKAIRERMRKHIEAEP